MQLSSFWQHVFDFPFLGATLNTPVLGILAADFSALSNRKEAEMELSEENSRKFGSLFFAPENKI